MRKMTLAFIILLIASFVTGCGVFNKDSEVVKEIKQTLNQKDVQVQIAFGDDFDAKRGLIKSLELHAQGLVALCVNPDGLNTDSNSVQEWYREAVERTALTAEQEMQIAKLDKFAYTKALLLKSNLTPEGLVAVCKNPGEVSLGNLQLQKMFVKAMARTALTAEQEVQIAKLDEFAYTQALLLKNNLTPEGLVAVCENPGEVSLRNLQLKRMFVKAMERTTLTAEHEVRIAKLGEFTYTQALLLKSNLTPEGLVAVCENPGDANLKNRNIQKMFREAIKRTTLTEEQRIKIANSKINGIGLF